MSIGVRISSNVRADVRENRRVLNSALSSLAYHARLDAQESMRRELDRPKPYTQKAVLYQRSTLNSLKSSVFINRDNEYLPRLVHTGIRYPLRKKILIPSPALRTDQYGNMSRSRRRRMLSRSNTFSIQSRGRTLLMTRIRKRLTVIGLLSDKTRYPRQYYDFYGSAIKTYDRRFDRLMDQAFERHVLSR